MNFLQIAKRVRQEMGASGDGPASVIGQTGHYAKIVSWVLSAHEEVQLVFADWNFNWGTDEQDLTGPVIDPSNDWEIDLLGLIPDSVNVVRDGMATPVTLVNWGEFRLQPASGEGTPNRASLAPDRKIHLSPAPSSNLKLRFEYLRKPQVLQQNQDVPRLDPSLHMAIVWRAVMFGTAHDENGSLFQSASANYRGIVSKMAASEMPEITIGGALA